MTIRQKRLAKQVGISRTMGEAMLASGYAKSTSLKKTAAITQTPGFKELLEQHLPISDAFKLTKDAYKAVKIVALPDEPNIKMEDHAIRLKAAEQTYKLHGVYNEEANTKTVNIQVVTYANDPLAAFTGSPGATLPDAGEIQNIQLAPKVSEDY